MSSEQGQPPAPPSSSEHDPIYNVVLVTGAGGYLGQCLIHKLLSLQQQQQQQQHEPNEDRNVDNDDNINKFNSIHNIYKLVLADIYFPSKFHFSSINDLLSLQHQQQQDDTTTTNNPTNHKYVLPILKLIQGDISDPKYCNTLFQELIKINDTSSTSSLTPCYNNMNVSIFHFGAVMSGDGERNFDLCCNVNLYGTINILNCTKTLTSKYYNTNNTTDSTANDGRIDTENSITLVQIPKVIFCSAGATIGAGTSTDYIQSSDTISDSCRATPHSTYGMTKACCELLLSDYTRRNFLDGRAIRLPTIIVRAGTPNAATTSCFSSIIREPLAGIDLANIPIDPNIYHAVTSTRSAINAILQFHNVSKDQIDTICGYDRTIFIPAIAVSLNELQQTLYNTIIDPKSHSILGKIQYNIDPIISNMVASFPTKINPYRAQQFHIPNAPTIETMIREYIHDFPSAIHHDIQILPPTITTATTTTTAKVRNTYHDYKIAIVTGAGSGIGRAVTQRFVQDGNYIVILAGRKIHTLQETQDLCCIIKNDTTTSTDKSNNTKILEEPINIQLISSSNDILQLKNNCICISTDVTIEDDIKRLFHIVYEIFERIDLLFNNAGMNSIASSIETVSLTDFEHVMSTNVTGPFLCSRAAIQYMSKQVPMGGRIINNGSLSSHVPRPNSTTYSTSKHALTGLTKCIALDGRKYNVACGQVDFGNIVTELSLNTNKIGVGALQANGTYMVEPSMNVQDAAETVYTMANLPLEANILQMTVMATTMPYVGRG
jgi:D-erythronate 2-dehydrogenase